MSARGFADETLTLPDGAVALRRRTGEASAGTILFVHANGLNKGAYAPMLSAFSGPQTVIALDLRGHGRTTLPAEPHALTRWDLYAEDLLRIVRVADLDGPLILVGHSLGAVCALLAAAAGLDAERLVLIEPVTVPRLARLVARSALRRSLLERRGIAQRAAGRRNGWPDEAAVRAQYEASRFFSDWDEAALGGYLADGLLPDGNGVGLSCAPAWEAASFAAQGHRFWQPLSLVAARLPVHILAARGGHSTMPPAARSKAVRTGSVLTEMNGNHMLPTERPADVAAFLEMTLSDGGA